MNLDYFAQVQASVLAMMSTALPQFWTFGNNMTISVATVVIAWSGIQIMLSSAPFNEHIHGFAKTLLFVSMVYGISTFYSSPIPGFGSSFTGLIVNQTAYFSSVLDANAVANIYQSLDMIEGKIIAPGALEVTAGFLYVLLMLALAVAKALSMAVVSFGLIASAICALLGPLVIWSLLIPQLNWLFWGWLRAFFQYSMVPVVALAYLLVMERFINAYATSLPAGITQGTYLIYVMQSLVVIATFVIGIVLVPSLTHSIFNGGGSQSILDVVRRRF